MNTFNITINVNEAELAAVITELTGRFGGPIEVDQVGFDPSGEPPVGLQMTTTTSSNSGWPDASTKEGHEAWLAEFDRRIAGHKRWIADFDARMADMEARRNDRIAKRAMSTPVDIAVPVDDDQKAISGYVERLHVVIGAVPCDKCGARVGDQCMSPGGTPYGYSFIHNDRRQRANKQRGAS